MERNTMNNTQHNAQFTFQGITVALEDISPELAEQYLSKNTHNRNLRIGKVGIYAEDMENGRWKWKNGSTIVFNENGLLDDGQHRLHAVIESGQTVRMIVVRGADEGAQDTIDTGIGRKFQDVLKLRGELNYITLATAVRSIHMWQRGDRLFHGQKAPSNPQLLQTLSDYPWIRDVTTLLNRVSVNSHLPTTVSAALYFALVQIDAEDADFFFNNLGSELKYDMPQQIFVLRKVLQDNHDSIKGTRNTRYLAALTIKAWNGYRAGEEIGLLKWRAGGANPEKFPEPK